MIWEVIQNQGTGEVNVWTDRIFDLRPPLRRKIIGMYKDIIELS